MRRKRLIISLLIFIALIIIGYLSVKPAFNYISGYLSKTEHVKANILIVEGWLPRDALKMAYNEFEKNGYDLIVTTGLKFSPDYYRFPADGFMIFYPIDRNTFKNDIRNHLIEVDAYSEMDGVYTSHFNMFVNDSRIGGTFVEMSKRNYPFYWEGSLNEIDSLKIQFDNDRVDENGDNNLYIRQIIIDKRFSIPYLYNVDYDSAKTNARRIVINSIDSNAELARKRLIELGIDSSVIKAVSAKKVRVNRTLTSALAFRDWLQGKNIDVKGINILSMGTHARRTWMSYNKILDEKYKIGVISLPDEDYNNSPVRKTIKTIRETLGIIYYWIILIPY
jgi:hypothetical protein